jgi:hypothetical protein
VLRKIDTELCAMFGPLAMAENGFTETAILPAPQKQSRPRGGGIPHIEKQRKIGHFRLFSLYIGFPLPVSLLRFAG